MSEQTMKPMMVLKRGVLAAEDIVKLTENGLCVVESDDPSALKFIDTIPSMVGRTAIEDAAIQMSRRLLGEQFWVQSNQWVSRSRSDVTRLFVEMLLSGSPLSEAPTLQEKEREYFNRHRMEELELLARQEAREERAAAKAARDAKAKGAK